MAATPAHAENTATGNVSTSASAPAASAPGTITALDLADDDVTRLFMRPMPLLTEIPVDGELSSPFGVRRDPFNRRRRRRHAGLDFHAPRNTEVRASGPGLVVKAQRYHGYGRVVFIDHGLGVETRYAHLQKIDVEVGDFVYAGTPIGTVGSSGRATGPHLHYEIRVDGEAIPPAEAMEYDLFPRRGWLGRFSTLLRGWQRTCVEMTSDRDQAVSRCGPHVMQAPRRLRASVRNSS